MERSATSSGCVVLTTIESRLSHTSVKLTSSPGMSSVTASAARRNEGVSGQCMSPSMRPSRAAVSWQLWSPDWGVSPVRLGGQAFALEAPRSRDTADQSEPIPCTRDLP